MRTGKRANITKAYECYYTPTNPFDTKIYIVVGKPRAMGRFLSFVYLGGIPFLSLLFYYYLY